MAYTKADLDRIDAAIKSGKLRVKFDKRETEFRTMNEMLQIRNLIIKELEGNHGSDSMAETTFQLVYRRD